MTHILTEQKVLERRLLLPRCFRGDGLFKQLIALNDYPWVLHDNFHRAGLKVSQSTAPNSLLNILQLNSGKGKIDTYICHEITNGDLNKCSLLFGACWMCKCCRDNKVQVKLCNWPSWGNCIIIWYGLQPHPDTCACITPLSYKRLEAISLLFITQVGAESVKTNIKWDLNHHIVCFQTNALCSQQRCVEPDLWWTHCYRTSCRTLHSCADLMVVADESPYVSHCLQMAAGI